MDQDTSSTVDKIDFQHLNESTKQLLSLLEEIQRRVFSSDLKHNVDYIPSDFDPSTHKNISMSITDKICEKAFKKLQYQARYFDSEYIEEEADDCSVYKRLTRKCNCLNRPEFNDFVMNFNENVKYFSNNMGEIIKNIKILKKFLYIGGDYTNNALVFLNEGLSEARYNEKVEIVNGCAYVDICNVFEESTIVATCIGRSHKFESFSDVDTQSLLANFLHELVRVEEGRRYLNYNTKIEFEIMKLLRKKISRVDFDTLEILHKVMRLQHESINRNANVTFYCRRPEKGMSGNIIDVITQHRDYMTQDELIKHLNLINHLCRSEKGKTELLSNFSSMIKLFKNLLMEFDNLDVNVVLVNILNNIMTARANTANVESEEKFVEKEEISEEGTFRKSKEESETVDYVPKSRVIKRNNAFELEIYSNALNSSNEKMHENLVTCKELEKKYNEHCFPKSCVIKSNGTSVMELYSNARNSISYRRHLINRAVNVNFLTCPNTAKSETKHFSSKSCEIDSNGEFVTKLHSNTKVDTASEKNNFTNKEISVNIVACHKKATKCETKHYASKALAMKRSHKSKWESDSKLIDSATETKPKNEVAGGVETDTRSSRKSAKMESEHKFPKTLMKQFNKKKSKPGLAQIASENTSNVSSTNQGKIINKAKNVAMESLTQSTKSATIKCYPKFQDNKTILQFSQRKQHTFNEKSNCIIEPSYAERDQTPFWRK